VTVLPHSGRVRLQEENAMEPNITLHHEIQGVNRLLELSNLLYFFRRVAVETGSSGIPSKRRSFTMREPAKRRTTDSSLRV
jgi:hypothetical protein